MGVGERAQMQALTANYDAIIVGGGFFGATIGLAVRKSLNKVLIVEKEASIMSRASYANQARVHMGYHYPRSYMTAFRSLINYPRFCADFSSSIDRDFQQVYAIARNNSKITSYQFRKFCEQIGAPISEVPADIRNLFDDGYIEDVFRVQEVVFDATKLRAMIEDQLYTAGVPVLYNTTVLKVANLSTEKLSIYLDDGTRLQADRVFSCTYSQINAILRNSGLRSLALKHELCEIALIQVPEELMNLGITVMDGPFFSTLPFPSRHVHSLSHVRYTPHTQWYDLHDCGGPDDQIGRAKPQSKIFYMLRDASRYVLSRKLVGSPGRYWKKSLRKNEDN